MADWERRWWLLSIILIILIVLAYRTEQSRRGQGGRGGGSRRTCNRRYNTASEIETNEESPVGVEQGTTSSTKIGGSLDVIQYPNAQNDGDIYVGQEAILRLTVNFSRWKETLTDTRIYLRISPEIASSKVLGLSTIYKALNGNGVVLDEHWRNPTYTRRYVADEDTRKAVSYATKVYFVLGNVNHGFQNTDHDITIEYGVMNFGGYGTLAVGTEIETSILVAPAQTSFLHLSMNFTYKGLKPGSGENKHPTISFDHIDEIEEMKPLTFELKMSLPNTINHVWLTVDAFEEIRSDVMDDVTANGEDETPFKEKDNVNASGGSYSGLLVQSIVLTRAGLAYRRHLDIPRVKELGYETCPLTPTLTLELGPIVRTDTNRSFIEDTEKAEFDVLAFDVTLLLTDTLNRSKIHVVLGVNVNNAFMWVERLNLTVLKPVFSEDRPYIKSPLFTIWQPGIKKLVPERNISSGTKDYIVAMLETPRLSNRTYRIKLSTSPLDSSRKNALRILTVKPTNYGKNLICQTFPSLESHVENNVWSYVYEIHVVNIGLEADIGTFESVVYFNITFVMLGNASEGDIYRLASQLDGVPGPAITYTIDAPPKARFELSAADHYVRSRYPGFVSVKIHTVPGTTEVYNGTITVTSRAHLIQAMPMSILTVNPIYAGANVMGSIGPQDLTINLLSSQNDSVVDVATFTFTVINTGENPENDADDVELEIVVEMKHSGIDYLNGHPASLLVAINLMADQTVQMSAIKFTSYDDSISKEFLGPKCPGEVRNNRELLQFWINIKTQAHTTAGPVQIRIKWSLSVAVKKVYIPWKRRNVACVNLGPIETDQEYGPDDEHYTVVNLPLVCNRRRAVNDVNDVEDDGLFSIVVVLTLRQNEDSDKSHTHYAVPIEINTTADTVDDVYKFSTKPRVDLGELRVVEKVHLIPDSSTGLSTYPEVFLEWSLDGTHKVTSALMGTQVQTYESGGQYLEPTYPIVARYLRVLIQQSSCYIKFEAITNYDIPYVHGHSTTKTQPLLERILHTALRHFRSMSKCAQLPLPGDQETPPYLWMDFKTSLFNVDASGGPFMVTLVGHGIQCSHTGSHQKTMVVFPKEKLTVFGEKQNQLCEVYHADLTSEDGVRCEYKCACTGEKECSQFTLLIMSTGTSVERRNAGKTSTSTLETEETSKTENDPYSLCYIDAWRQWGEVK